MKPMDAMQEQLLRYFTSEKQESLLFLVLGMIAWGISLFLLKTNSSYRGMIYPFLIIGLIQIIVGGSVYFRTDNQVKNLTAQLQSDPAAFRSAELPRMDKVNAGFRIYKFVEIVLLAAGIIIALRFRNHDLPYAIAIGLIIQSSIMLVLDLFAEKRAHDYITWIRQLL